MRERYLKTRLVTWKHREHNVFACILRHVYATLLVRVERTAANLVLHLIKHFAPQCGLESGLRGHPHVAIIPLESELDAQVST